LAGINAHRAVSGLAPFQRLVQIDMLTQAHERDQALRNYDSHTNPEGLDYTGRVMAINPPGSLDDWGEIIAQGQATPATVVSAWLGSPGHLQIINTPAYKYAGVGVYWDSGQTAGDELYWGVFFTAYKGGAAPPADHDWIEPHEVQ
ncbi:MAG: CAP domain-containing protein, partial [bacterium]|nr:CAP domain-containing protein [bacterium]